MTIKPLVLAFALAASFGAAAQGPASAPPKAAAPASPAKKALVAKVLQVQQPGIEGMARQLTEQPAVAMLQQVSQAVQQRVPADRRDAVFRDLQAEAKKYADETTPLVRASAVRIAPTTIGALLEERFTEDELKQLLVILESPINRKYQQLAPDMQRVLVEKLVAETRPQVETRVKALEQTIVKKLETASAPPPAAAPPTASGSRP